MSILHILPRHILILLLLTGVTILFAQPKPPPAPLYTPPDYHAVLAGKVPLRLLVLSHQPMLAWKGEGEVHAVNLPDKSELYTSATDELIGLARATDDKSASLRRDSKNFCPAPGVIRLTSDKPIKLWSPGPNGWTTYTTPLIITPLPDGTFSVATELELEDYVRNVVPGEMPSSFHPQALCAQAILARTFTLYELGRHADEGADVCTGVHCQVYGNTARRSKQTDEACANTRGVILLYGDKPAATYYHSTCGGTTDDAGYVWGPEYAHSYLTGSSDLIGQDQPVNGSVQEVLSTRDAFCVGSKSFRWTKTYTAAEVNALVARNLTKVTGDAGAKISVLTGMTVENRTPGGRAASLRVEGNNMSVLVTGDNIRWLFGSGGPGADGLPSTLFDLTVIRDHAGAITGCIIRGGGRGHGLGLCQWGADGRGKAGQSYRQILRAYFPGTRLSDERK